MTTPAIQFTDGASYERFMGKWSQLAGRVFLEWLDPKPGLRWLDVGCGNGAFTELLLDRCAPESVVGLDPSPAQLAHARQRLTSAAVEFHQGDAMAQPFADDSFDAAVMPLVIFFVSDPAKGVAEMARVVRPGGLVAAYAWDMAGGGFPYAALMSEMRALNLPLPSPPSADASRIDRMRELWSGAGLAAMQSRQITVERTFADFDDYWATLLSSPSAGPTLAAMPPHALAQFRATMRTRVAADHAGPVTCRATANAVTGVVPS